MHFSDAQLLARAIADDDRNAFAELVRRHQSAVRNLLRRLTCGEDALADDLAQETFLRAYRGLAGFRQDAKLSTWLYRIAYNVYLDERARRREPQPGDDEPIAATAKSALFRHDLLKAMRHLSESERAAIALTFGRDQSHEEAAAALGWPLGTLKTHVLRGKAKLRTLLGAWGEPDARREEG
jgi:RNA polymerase sigma-70 factor (ECF subfamily)